MRSQLQRKLCAAEHACVATWERRQVCTRMVRALALLLLSSRTLSVLKMWKAYFPAELLASRDPVAASVVYAPIFVRIVGPPGRTTAFPIGPIGSSRAYQSL